MHKPTFKEQKASKCHAYTCKSIQNIILKYTEVKKVKQVDLGTILPK